MGAVRGPKREHSLLITTPFFVNGFRMIMVFSFRLGHSGAMNRSI